MDSSLKRLSGNVIGDQSILFGVNKSFANEQCCNKSTAYAAHPNRIDLVIALDASRGVKAKFKNLKQFTEELTSRFVVSYNATRVAIVTWSRKTTLHFNFTRYMNNEGVKRGINNTAYSGGWSATGDALHFIRTNLFNTSPSNAKKVLFLMTNRGSNRQTYQPENEAKLMKDDGVEIFTIGIGSKIRDSELKSIASLPTLHHKFVIRTFTRLSSLGKLIHSEYLDTRNV